MSRRCVVTPRSDERVLKIREEWRKAEASLDSEGNYSENWFSKVLV
jgi:hypothetical protein